MGYAWDETFKNDSTPQICDSRTFAPAGTAPSGAHTEPWTYVVVSTPELKQQVRDIVEQEELINYTQRMGASETQRALSFVGGGVRRPHGHALADLHFAGDQWTTDLKPLRTNWEKAYLSEAPHLVMVFKQQYSLKDDGTRRNHYYNELSVAIASGILITAIHVSVLSDGPLDRSPRAFAARKRTASSESHSGTEYRRRAWSDSILLRVMVCFPERGAGDADEHPTQLRPRPARAAGPAGQREAHPAVARGLPCGRRRGARPPEEAAGGHPRPAVRR